MTNTIDHLEYYIKFPNPNTINRRQQLLATIKNDDNNDNDEENFVFVTNEENKTPIVLLFGWAGCQDKYLAKYSAIYETKGLITIRYTAPVSCLFWRRYQMKTISEQLVQLITDMQLDSHPIVVHLFSNGGAFLYQNFSNALNQITNNVTPFQINGVIFDSAPGQRRIVSLYRAISAIIGGRLFYNVSVSLLLTLFVSVVWLFEIIMVNVFGSKKFVAQVNLMDYLKMEKGSHPQHFIYSKCDPLIPYQDIEYFASYRKTQGVDVTTLCFDDSPHVKHYSSYGTAYVNSVYTFLRKCFSDNQL